MEMASGPSSAAATSGPEVMKATRPSKNGFALVDGVVPLGQIAVDLDKLEPDDPQSALFVAGEDPADQLALDAVGLDEDEGALGHWTDTAAVG